MKALTARQSRFVEEYLVDLNATQAAVRAGYSRKGASVRGSELLANPNVAAAIKGGSQSRQEQISVSAADVIHAWAALAFTDPREIVTWKDSTITLRNSAALTREQALCVTSVKETHSRNGDPVVEVKFADRSKALDSLARHLGIGGKESTSPYAQMLASLAQLGPDGIRALLQESPSPQAPKPGSLPASVAPPLSEVRRGGGDARKPGSDSLLPA